MRRFFLLVAVLGLVLAACAVEGAGSTTTEGIQVSTTSSATEGTAAPTTEPPDVSTTTSPESTEATSGRPAAPDFALELGDGGTYSLSDGTKPVYLVFWAEW